MWDCPRVCPGQAAAPRVRRRGPPVHRLLRAARSRRCVLRCSVPVIRPARSCLRNADGIEDEAGIGVGVGGHRNVASAALPSGGLARGAMAEVRVAPGPGGPCPSRMKWARQQSGRLARRRGAASPLGHSRRQVPRTSGLPRTRIRRRDRRAPGMWRGWSSRCLLGSARPARLPRARCRAPCPWSNGGSSARVSCAVAGWPWVTCGATRGTTTIGRATSEHLTWRDSRLAFRGQDREERDETACSHRGAQRLCAVEPSWASTRSC